MLDETVIAGIADDLAAAERSREKIGRSPPPTRT